MASELHPAFGALFNPALTPEAREGAIGNALKRIGKLEKLLNGGSFLNGKSLSAPDLYAYIVLSWGGFVGVTLPANAQKYFDGLKANEAIQKGHAAIAALQ